MSHHKVGSLVLLGLLGFGCGEEVEEAAPVLRPVRFERVSTDSLSVSRSLAAVIRAGVESRTAFGSPAASNDWT